MGSAISLSSFNSSEGGTKSFKYLRDSNPAQAIVKVKTSDNDIQLLEYDGQQLLQVKDKKYRV